MEIYLFLCAYRDECVQKGTSYKAMTYENFREILNLKKHVDNHKNIFTALAFLEKVGLIVFDIGSIANSRGAEIPVFRIREVNYHITQIFKNFNESELITEEEKQELQKMFKRVQEGFNKQEEIIK